MEEELEFDCRGKGDLAVDEEGGRGGGGRRGEGVSVTSK